VISASDRKEVIKLIDEARTNGARLRPACEVINISDRTYQRWVAEGLDTADKRPTAKRRAPANKLTEQERGEVIKVCNRPEYADLTPAQIVPKLADKKYYIASESTIYRILKDIKMNAKRTRVNKPRTSSLTTHIANGPNQVWSWDITWIPAEIKGHFYKIVYDSRCL
jgi:transposase